MRERIIIETRQTYRRKKTNSREKSRSKEHNKKIQGKHAKEKKQRECGVGEERNGKRGKVKNDKIKKYIIRYKKKQN